MKKIKLIKASKVKVKPFILDNFILYKAEPSKIEKTLKKELKYIAKTLGLSYDKNTLDFTQKVLTAYLRKR